MKHLLRLAFIVVTVLRFGLDEVALSVFPQPWVRLLVRLATLGRKLDRPRGERLRQELESEGIRIRTGSLPGLAEEAPQAYKDVDAVVEVVVGAGIAAKVARLRPLVVVKG